MSRAISRAWRRRDNGSERLVRLRSRARDEGARGDGREAHSDASASATASAAPRDHRSAEEEGPPAEDVTAVAGKPAVGRVCETREIADRGRGVDALAHDLSILLARPAERPVGMVARSRYKTVPVSAPTNPQRINADSGPHGWGAWRSTRKLSGSWPDGLRRTPATPRRRTESRGSHRHRVHAAFPDEGRNQCRRRTVVIKPIVDSSRALHQRTTIAFSRITGLPESLNLRIQGLNLRIQGSAEAESLSELSSEEKGGLNHALGRCHRR